jgi:hypothetical protein
MIAYAVKKNDGSGWIIELEDNGHATLRLEVSHDEYLALQRYFKETVKEYKSRFAKPTMELVLSVLKYMESGKTFCSAYRKYGMQEKPLREFIRDNEAIQLRYKKALAIAKEARIKKTKDNNYAKSTKG